MQIIRSQADSRPPADSGRGARPAGADRGGDGGKVTVVSRVLG